MSPLSPRLRTPPPPPPRRLRPRLLLAPLEDRAVPAAYTVNALTDTGAGVGTAGDLRYCLTQANASAGVPDTIDLTGVSGTITLSGGELPVTDAVALTG